MIITPVEFSLTLTQDKKRSAGTHVSSIIRAIALRMGYLKPEYASEEIGDPIKMELGLSWEDFVTKHHHPNVLYHPGELVKDGIAMSPDGISFVPEDAIHEFKLTWESMKRALDLESEFMWMMQIKSYCWALPTRLAYLHVFWLNGDYRYGTPGGAPQYRVYKLNFTEKELRDNWTMIRRYKETHGK